VVQSGLLHVRSFWDYITNYPNCPQALILQINRDLDWWAGSLEKWSQSLDTKGQFPILSGPEILAHPELIELMQSDASGADGYGYVYSLASDNSFKWKSSIWDPGTEPGNKGSHSAEIRALHDYILNCDHPGKLLVWVTDSESACYTINRANCKDPKALPYLKSIYETCDELGLLLVSLWVPRELNELADYLSHLSCLLHRDKVEGSASL
jgi:hypothetical protein